MIDQMQSAEKTSNMSNNAKTILKKNVKRAINDYEVLRKIIDEEPQIISDYDLEVMERAYRKLLKAKVLMSN